MKHLFKAVMLSAVLLSGAAQAGTLAINIAFKGASQRAVWQSTLDEFRKANPDIEIKAAFIDEEAYKVQLPGWLLTAAPDAIPGPWPAGSITWTCAAMATPSTSS